jgi:ATP-dependent Clp protease protease subunit
MLQYVYCWFFHGVTMAQDKDDDNVGNNTSLNDAGIYLLMGDIDTESVKPVIEWILHSNYVVKRKKKELQLMICSSGGDVSSAFALIDIMLDSNIPIKTIGLGTVASCGLLVFIAGTKGRRVLTPNTSILSHQFSWGSDGKAHELFAQVKEFELTQARMIEHYKKCTGMNEESIKAHLLPPQDVWLSADEALQLHLTDHVAVR